MVFVVVNIVFLPDLVAVLCFAVLDTFFVVWRGCDNGVYCVV